MSRAPALLLATGSSSDFPAIVTTNSSTASSTASHNASLPASLVSGNLLLLFISIAENRTINSVSGWTQLYNTSASLDGGYACFYKTSNGSEGSTVTVTTGTSTSSMSCQTYQISGWGSTPESTQNNTSNPPNLSPTGGSKKYLWITHGAGGNGGTVTTVPSGYGSQLGASTVGSTAHRTNEASSEDPGAWTISGSNSRAATIAVHPA